MIRTSRNELRNTIAKQYINMLAESRNLSEEEINELGKWWRNRQAAKKGVSASSPEIEVTPPPAKTPFPRTQKPKSPGRVDVGGGAEVLDPEVSDFERELNAASWMSDDPDAFAPSHRAAKTQTDMRTVDIGDDKRPYAKKVGLSEAQLRSVISSMIRGTLKEGLSSH